MLQDFVSNRRLLITKVPSLQRTKHTTFPNVDPKDPAIRYLTSVGATLALETKRSKCSITVHVISFVRYNALRLPKRCGPPLTQPISTLQGVVQPFCSMKLFHSDLRNSNHTTRSLLIQTSPGFHCSHTTFSYRWLCVAKHNEGNGCTTLFLVVSSEQH